MSARVITFFGSRGGLGRSSLVFHLAWMLSEMGKNVVALDLDPQAGLTTAFLSEADLEQLWGIDDAAPCGNTIYRCVRPLAEGGDVLSPRTSRINARLHLVPGDMAFAGFDDALSQAWFRAAESTHPGRSFRALTSLWQVAQLAAQQHDADLVLMDVGPGRGAINRSALIATDHLVVPLAADLHSLHGLRDLGSTLREWRAGWMTRVRHWIEPAFELPAGQMDPLGYVLMRQSERLARPANAYTRWAGPISLAYRESIAGDTATPDSAEGDAYCLGNLKQYLSLLQIAHEVRKPIFQLTAADGAIGSHSYAVRDAAADYRALADRILSGIGA